MIKTIWTLGVRFKTMNIIFINIVLDHNHVAPTVLSYMNFSCYADTNCFISDSICSQGLCQCRDGFIPDGTLTRCLRGISIIELFMNKIFSSIENGFFLIFFCQHKTLCHSHKLLQKTYLHELLLPRIQSNKIFGST